MRSGGLLAKNLPRFVVWCRVTVGVAPAVRRRAFLALTLREREEISPRAGLRFMDAHGGRRGVWSERYRP